MATSANSRRRSMSVENIQNLSGINTGAGELSFTIEQDGRSSRFSLMWRSEDGDMLTDVIDLYNYTMKCIEEYNLVELTPHSKEEKQINITFKDSESLDLFRANMIEDATRKKSKSVSHADRRVKQSRRPTVHEDNLSTKLKPIQERSMQGIMLTDIHVRYEDLSPPVTTTEDQTCQTGIGEAKEEGDSTSHGPLKSDEDRSSTGSDESKADDEDAALTVVQDTSRGIQDIRLEERGESSA